MKRLLPAIPFLALASLCGCADSAPTASKTVTASRAAFAGVVPTATGFTLLHANGGHLTIDTRDWACVSKLAACSTLPAWPGLSGMPPGAGAPAPGTMAWNCTPLSSDPARHEMRCLVDGNTLHFVAAGDGFELSARGPAGELHVTGHGSPAGAAGEWSFQATGCDCSASGSFTGTR